MPSATKRSQHQQDSVNTVDTIQGNTRVSLVCVEKGLQRQVILMSMLEAIKVEDILAANVVNYKSVKKSQPTPVDVHGLGTSYFSKRWIK